MARPPAPAKSSTLFIEKPPDSRFETGRVPQLAFPDGQHLPAFPRERSLVPPVPVAITFQFSCPKVNARFGHARQSAIVVAVPQPPMDEHKLAPRAGHEVRTTWQRPPVPSLATTQRHDNH